MPVIPTTYDEWEHCITVECGIPLTLPYVEERLRNLQNTSDLQTERFIERWGRMHHERTLGWFREAQQKLQT